MLFPESLCQHFLEGTARWQCFTVSGPDVVSSLLTGRMVATLPSILRPSTDTSKSLTSSCRPTRRTPILGKGFSRYWYLEPCCGAWAGLFWLESYLSTGTFLILTFKAFNKAVEASDKNYVEPRVGAESRKPAKKSTGSDKLITVYLKESRRVGSPCAACYCYHEATSYSFIILTYF